eukprot:SAG31_NODE_4650_length_3068_cov_2.827888_1_plen_94_part_00
MVRPSVVIFCKFCIECRLHIVLCLTDRCNGADVPVHVYDVTAAVAKTSGASVNVTYHATGPHGKQPGQGNKGGNIVLSSVLAWYFDAADHDES